MVVITGEYRRCTARYGERGVRYTHMEAGNVSQNLFLAAEALGLGAGIVGAFEDKALAQVLKLPPAHEPLLVMPVGYKLRGNRQNCRGPRPILIRSARRGERMRVVVSGRNSRLLSTARRH